MGRGTKQNRRMVLKSAFITTGITSGIGASSFSVIGKPSYKEVKIITAREGEKIRDTSIVPKNGTVK